VGRVSLTVGEEQIAFYYTIGQAITAWAFVESELRGVVESCFESGEDQITWRAINVGFLSIDAFRVKMDFAEELVARRFTQRRKPWLQMVKDGRALSQKRNKLAHWRVALYDKSDPGRRYLLTPWVFPKRKQKHPPKRPIPPDGSLGIRDIAKYESEFIAYAMTLENFSHFLRGEPEPNATELLQPAHPLTMAALKAQIRAELARLLAPSEQSQPAES
jgi:hypothetical protein